MGEEGMQKMEQAEDIVIAGGGIAGLATALGFHRLGLRSLVLESSDSLRASGYALTILTNAWKALDALGIADELRRQHVQIQGLISTSIVTGTTTAKISFMEQGKCGNHEVRCVLRNILLETLAKELPQGTIKFGSKIVSVEKAKGLVFVQLADGSILKSKVLIGCEGVNSIVGKWLGLSKATFTGRSAVRGIVEFPDCHGCKPEFYQYFGEGFRSGFLPCNEKTIYWFFTHSSSKLKYVEDDPAKMKQYVLKKLSRAMPEQVTAALEKTPADAFVSIPLRMRLPWNLLWGNICKGGVCVAGDALHPMTPDIGQGGCSALEDAVVLTRNLGEALLGQPDQQGDEAEDDKIKRGLEKYMKERRWRCIELIATSYVIGLIQQSAGLAMSLLRDKCLPGLMAALFLKKADFDCGKLKSL